MRGVVMKDRLKKALLVSTVVASGLLASCSTMQQLPDNAASLPLAQTPTSKILLNSTDEKMFTLETPPQLRTLTPEQRIGRIELLKKNIEGFTPTQTAKIAKSIEMLFSLDQEYVRALADNIPDDIKIKNALNYKNVNTMIGIAMYDQEENALYMFPGLVNEQNQVEIAARLAHELNHGKQNVEGLLEINPAYIDAGKYITLKFAIEADSKVLHQSVFHQLAEREKLKTGKNIKWSEEGEQENQNIYNQIYRQSLSHLKAKFPTKDSKKLQNDATFMANGRYMTSLLKGKDKDWSRDYLLVSMGQLMYTVNSETYFAAQSNPQVLDYIFEKLAQKHGLSKTVFFEPERRFLNDNNKAFAKARKGLEFNYSYEDAHKIYIKDKSKLDTRTFTSPGGLLKHFKAAEKKGLLEKQGAVYVYKGQWR